MASAWMYSTFRPLRFSASPMSCVLISCPVQSLRTMRIGSGESCATAAPAVSDSETIAARAPLNMRKLFFMVAFPFFFGSPYRRGNGNAAACRRADSRSRRPFVLARLSSGPFLPSGRRAAADAASQEPGAS